MERLMAINWKLRSRSILAALFILSAFAVAMAQEPRSAAVELGSHTAKNGFMNEDEIRDKFNNWKLDEDARAWLAAMNYDIARIESVTAVKPHGEKADVVVRIRIAKRSDPEYGDIPQSRKDAEGKQNGIVEKAEGISIKLVSGPNGFNQVDKRWLRQYAKMWNMPADVVAALRLFTGEEKPTGPSRRPERMFLTELDKAAQSSVVEFFTANKEKIVSDILAGDGPNRAKWLMVALRSGNNTRWTVRPIEEAIRFYSKGPVELTRAGSLKIGRVTMQRKGGDGGRETANQLQFKINPALLFV